PPRRSGPPPRPRLKDSKYPPPAASEGDSSLPPPRGKVISSPDLPPARPRTIPPGAGSEEASGGFEESERSSRPSIPKAPPPPRRGSPLPQAGEHSKPPLLVPPAPKNAGSEVSARPPVPPPPPRPQKVDAADDESGVDTPL